jgi:poly-gamma-glutamate synthesis protein (capsule biosynthesis protein)
MSSLSPLQAVFENGHQELRPPSGDITTFSFTGDICLIREVEERLRENPEDAITGMREALAADYVIGNLETPLSKALLDPQRGALQSDPALAQVLIALGFDAFTIANNHTMDCGADGLHDTLSFLSQNNIAHFGAGDNWEQARRPLIVERNNIKIGLLGYSQPELDAAGISQAGVAPLRKKIILEDIVKLRPQVDVIALTLHEGYEFQYYPRLDFVNLCRELAQHVDVICGHHPHVLQGMETVGNSLILYSLGNFWFDMTYQRRVPETREGLIAHISFDKNGPVFLKLIPTFADEKSLLRIASAEHRERILQHLKNISSLLQDTESIREQNALSAAKVMRAILGAVYNLGLKDDKAGFEKYVEHQIRRDPYLKTFCDYAELIGGYKSTF